MLFDYNFRRYNYRLILYMLALSVIGILMITSASNHDSGLVTKQLIGIMAGFALAVGVSIIDYHKLLNLYALIYALCVLSLAAVLIWGHESNGATRWITVPVLGRLQPSEFVKIGLILFLAWFCTKNQETLDQPSVVGAAFVLCVIPIGLIFLEPNLSTSLITVVVVVSIIYAAGISYRWILGALGVLSPIAALFIFLLRYEKIPFIKTYQASRILAWVYPEKYATARYQQDNSIMAISSGQLQGKGLFNTTITSVKDGNFLSQEHTDFIFAVIGEEMGFLGSVLVITLFLLLVYECLYTASRARDLSGKLICTGMAALVGFQAFANIAVATGIFPNTGIPLPFISYGVSSLVSVFIGMGLVLNVGLQRKNGNY